MEPAFGAVPGPRRGECAPPYAGFSVLHVGSGAFTAPLFSDAVRDTRRGEGAPPYAGFCFLNRCVGCGFLNL